MLGVGGLGEGKNGQYLGVLSFAYSVLEAWTGLHAGCHFLSPEQGTCRQRAGQEAALLLPLSLCPSSRARKSAMWEQEGDGALL